MEQIAVKNPDSVFSTEEKKQIASGWFKILQDQICGTFESLEQELANITDDLPPPGKFENKPWSRENEGEPNHSGSLLHGGGEMRIMHGRVFEKVGVNFSEVWGSFSEEFSGY